MDKTTFDLEADAAAIIFHKNMSSEIVLPDISDEETVDVYENQNMFVAMAILSLLDDEGFRKYVGAKLDDMLKTADNLKEDAVDAEDCPAGGCACCDVVHDADPGDGS